MYQADFSNLPIDAAVIPLPKPEITHHVTKISFIDIFLGGKIIIYSLLMNFQHKILLNFSIDLYCLIGILSTVETNKKY